MATCKGRKKDGTPCRSPIVLDNGYCRAHQDQATQAMAPEEPVRWTRERIEAAIAAHGGPEGLDLAGADLSNLDLSEMDLHGIVLGRWDEEGETWITANLQGAELWYANLQEADLGGANLQRAKLGDANLQGVSLCYADLQRTNLWYADLQGAELGYANLQGAELWYANLQEADLECAHLQGTWLRDADLQGTNLWGADLQEAILQFADLRGVDLLDVRTGGLLGIKLYRAKLDHTALKREQLGPAIGDELAGEYREAREAYLVLKQNFEDLGDYEAASWSYVKERQMEKACSAPWRARRFYGEEQLGDTSERKLPAHHPRVWWFFIRHTAKWLTDWAVELICLYGESIPRVLISMFLLLLVSAALFWGLRGVVDPATGEPYTRITDYLIFTLGAFTTTGFERLRPANGLIELLTTIEAILGISLTGLLGFVVGNKVRRS